MTMKSYEDKMTTLDLISILGLAFHGKRHPLCNKPSWFILPPPSHPPTISSRQQQQKLTTFQHIAYRFPIKTTWDFYQMFYMRWGISLTPLICY